MLVACALCAWGVLFLRSEGPRFNPSVTGTPTQAGVTAQREVAVDADTGKPEPTNIRAVAISETGDEKSTPHQDELTPLLERLRSAIEASVYERLDPGAVLEVGELLVDLEAGERAIPEPDPSGELRFPILGTPEGLSAELRVARAQNYANVLVLKTSLPTTGALLP